jgi:GNAT superfamily N-acetyltransferase
MSIQVCTLAERPDLHEQFWLEAFTKNWPAYVVGGGLIADLYYDSFFLEQPPFTEFALAAFDESQPDAVIARAFSVPFAFGAEAHRTQLPQSGWDGVVRWADWDWKTGRSGNAVSAIEVNVHPAFKGQQLSSLMLNAMRDNAKRLGFTDLYAPVRPNAKHLEPHTPMLEYAFRTRADGLPSDPWLRVHARAGASIVKVATASMTFSGSLAQWREWTGLAFDRSGEVIVPGALVPVLASLEHDHAAYVEPNVWMHHRLEG